MQNSNIPVWAQSDEDDGFPKPAHLLAQNAVVASDVLKRNLVSVLKSFNGIFDSVTNEISGLAVDEVTLNFAVDAKGAVELIGKLETGVTASISITLKPKCQQKPNNT